MKGSAFKQFCTEKWFEHKDEILDWTGNTVGYDAEYYFNKHKWLLKRMFQEQFAQENHLKIQKEIKRSMKKGNL
jgi:hypothetical protein